MPIGDGIHSSGANNPNADPRRIASGGRPIRKRKHGVLRLQPPQQECTIVMPPARQLVEELGSAYVQYSFRSQLVFSAAHALAVNEIRQTDFLSVETSCGFAGGPFRLAATASGGANCPSELSVYSL